MTMTMIMMTTTATIPSLHSLGEETFPRGHRPPLFLYPCVLMRINRNTTNSNLRLARMCALLTNSHRRTERTAFSIWEKALEEQLAGKFAEDMLRYEHTRLFATLSAAKQRWETKIVRRRFGLWRRSARLTRTAENEVRVLLFLHISSFADVKSSSYLVIVQNIENSVRLAMGNWNLFNFCKQDVFFPFFW